MSEAEIKKIAAYLDMTFDDFVAKHTDLRLNRTGLTLKVKPNGECEFLNGIDCQINPVKPDQRAGFPNKWNFPGWKKTCEALPVSLEEKA